MKVTINIETRLLDVTLSKPEHKKLNDAWSVIETLARLNPVAHELKEAATEAEAAIERLVKACGAFEESGSEA